jgi:hypothetical protein
MAAPLGNRYAVGNRGYQGREREKLITRALMNRLAEIPPNSRHARTRADRIALAMIKEAEMGNVHAAEFIANRTEGKVKDQVDLNVNGGLVPTITTAMSDLEAQKLYEATINGWDVDLQPTEYHEEPPPPRRRRSNACGEKIDD